MADYQVTTETVSSLRDKVSLPQYQRGYVWNKQKKIELIDSLHRGFPFGALLTYTKNNERQKLLDGQQRWSTIVDFSKNSAEYWKELESVQYRSGLDELNSWIVSGEYISEVSYDEALSGKTDLADWADELRETSDFGEHTSRDIRDVVNEYKNKIREYLKVEDVKIPVIQYTGSEENTAQVFENLNKGGVQLTKFEIFAAAWSHTHILLDTTKYQNEILEEVKRFYINKQEDAEKYDFDLDGFSEDELTKKEKLIYLNWVWLLEDLRKSVWDR